MTELLSIKWTNFHLSTFLVAVVCFVLIRNVLADQGKVCGTTDVRKLQHFSRLENCHVIEGDLSIVLLDDEKVWENFNFPNLTEITGVLLLFRVQGLRSLGKLFPNLVVIGGQSTFLGYALVVYELFDLEDIGLSSLTVIRNGAVRFEKNPKLCYIDTVDWGRITKGVPASENYFGENRHSIECVDICPGQCGITEGVRRCWNARNCQKMLTCPQDCVTGYCNGDICCHPSCIGGCTGPLASQCTSCAAIEHTDENGVEICTQQCSEGLYMYQNRRCLTADQCINFADYGPDWDKCRDGECGKLLTDSNKVPICTIGCPAGYLPDPNDKTTCVKCENGKCPADCRSRIIKNLDGAKSLSGCTVIEGSLEFKLGNCVDEEKLEEYLSSITEVTGYIEVSNSIGLHSLYAFRGLQKIGGQHLRDDKYAFYVVNNQNLQDLFPNETLSRLTVGGGSALFQYNRKLGYDKIQSFLSKTGIELSAEDDSIAKETNGDKMSASEHTIELSILKTSPRIAFFTWKEPDFNDSPNIYGYSLKWKEVAKKSVAVFAEGDQCSDVGWNSKECVSRPCTPAYLHGLKPWTQYAVYVRALSVNSDGDVSNVFYFRTAADVPSKPTNVEVNAESPGTLHLTWDPPVQPNGIITSYKIHWENLPIRPEEYRHRDYCIYPLRVDEDKSKQTEKPTDCCPCPRSSRLTPRDFQDTLQNTVYVKRDEFLKRKRRGLTEETVAEEESPTNVVQVYNAIEFTITNLGHFEVYNIQIQACQDSNSDQSGYCSAPEAASGRTLSDESADVIDTVSVERVTNGFQIKWDDPPRPNGLILSYEIVIVAEGREMNPVVFCIPCDGDGENEYTVTYLEPDSYKIKVRATSLAGTGPWTPSISYTLTEPYQCYNWTVEDVFVMGIFRTPAKEKKRCEDDLGYVFTQGKNDNFPGCPTCWCCKPTN